MFPALMFVIYLPGDGETIYFHIAWDHRLIIVWWAVESLKTVIDNGSHASFIYESQTRELVWNKEREVMKKALLLLMGLCLFFAMKAQVVTYVEMKESGTLLNLLTDQEIERTEKIVISGNILMEKDFAVLKTMLVQHNLREVDIENTNTYTITERAFEGCSNLSAIKLPKYLINTGWYAFMDCSSLKDIELPSSVEVIANSFRGCSSLTSITLGRRVKSVDTQSFYLCGNLMEVHCKGSIPPSCKQDSFKGLYETCTLYVPEGCKRDYTFADGWLNFDNIREEYVEPTFSLQVNLKGGTFAWRLYPNYEGTGGIVVNDFYPGQDYLINVEKDETVVFHIAEENAFYANWQIDTIYLNGEDITTRLTEHDLLYLTIHRDSKLDIVMKDLSVTSNEVIGNSLDIKISTLHDRILIQDITRGEQLRVYNISGSLIYSGIAKNNNCQIQLPSGQVYFVQVGTEVIKIKM